MLICVHNPCIDIFEMKTYFCTDNFDIFTNNTESKEFLKHSDQDLELRGLNF